MKKLKEEFAGVELEEILLSIMLSIMLVVLTLQVFCRYVLQSSLSWSEELSRYIFAWLVWVSAAYATKKMRHLRITAFKDSLPKEKQWVLDLLALVVMVIFAVIYGITAVRVVVKVAGMNQLSPAMRIPMWIPYLSVPVGIILLGYRAAQNAFYMIKEHFGNKGGTKQ